MYLLFAWICPYVAGLFQAGQSPLTIPLYSWYQGACSSVGHKLLYQIINTKFLIHQLHFPSLPSCPSQYFISLIPRKIIMLPCVSTFLWPLKRHTKHCRNLQKAATKASQCWFLLPTISLAHLVSDICYDSLACALKHTGLQVIGHLYTGHTTWAFKTRSKHNEITNIDAQDEPLWSCKPFACTEWECYEGQHLCRMHAQPQTMVTTLQAILYRGQAHQAVAVRDLLPDAMKYYFQITAAATCAVGNYKIST